MSTLIFAGAGEKRSANLESGANPQSGVHTYLPPPKNRTPLVTGRSLPNPDPTVVHDHYAPPPAILGALPRLRAGNCLGR
jgi:hypothetical protein